MLACRLLFVELLSGCRSRNFCSSSTMVKVLNVAEKNDAAKSIADLMSNGRYRRREGFSRFNKIYEYNYRVMGQDCNMVMTSVSGHLLGLEFPGQYRQWRSTDPLALFDAPVVKECPQDYQDIKRTLEREVRSCNKLIIWTDCDREGENIGFEIIQVCQAIKPQIQVQRARFSEITPGAIQRAMANLAAPDKRVSDAVDVRQELDLRIGAAFTRFQTLRLQRIFPDVLAQQLISYGSCQFPTLGFVVERYKQVEAFEPEPFWKLQVSHRVEDSTCEFNWKRQRLFDQLMCQVLYEQCAENPTATVIDVKSKPKSKWRPVALDTVELEKQASRKLRMSAKNTMKIAEKLYTQGLISYPRTETNKFPTDLDLTSLVQMQTQDNRWGEFAGRILQSGGPRPRNGQKTDQAHPPIHPTKYSNGLQGEDARLYEYIVRHFLACVSEDAKGQETTVEIDIADERFTASGLTILARNYLEVFPYDRWSDKVVPAYELGQRFEPTRLEMVQGETSPPQLLTEADLIALMEKHGIGTDATHAEHIETIKSRLYVGVQNDGRFVPGELGMGLVDGYDSMGFNMSKPDLRAELEADLKRICEGRKNKDVVLREQVAKYRQVFEESMRQAEKLDTSLAQFFGAPQQLGPQDPVVPPPSVKRCPQCGSNMVLKQRNTGSYFLSCMMYPQCRHALWFPDSLSEVTVADSTCPTCTPVGAVRMLKMKTRRGSFPPSVPELLTACVGGCDPDLLETLNIQPSRTHGNNTQSNQASRTQANNTNSNQDSGYNSFRSTSTSQSSGTSQNRRTPQIFTNGSNQNSAPARPALANRSNLDFPSNSRNDLDPGSQVNCNCGVEARMFTVKKEGPNNGRQFYSCAKQPSEKCKFFQWADEVGSANARTRPAFNNAPIQNRAPPMPATNADIQCNCGKPAIMFTVNKDGPNKGRQFYTCDNPRDQKCNFFQWADEEPRRNFGGAPRPPDNGGGGRGQGAWGGGQGGVGGGQGRGQKRSTPSGGDQPRRTRTCGICRQPGHTRKTCPQA